MKKLSTRMVGKPKHLPQHDLIAIHGIYDVPQTPQDVMNPAYIKSELAVNDVEGLVQVYVFADNPSGLNKFKRDYPNADIRKDAALDDPDGWRVVAFTSETIPDESTALDNYFQARGREYIELTEQQIRKNREKK